MRCMKAIIAEHQEEKLHNDNLQCEGYQLCTGSSSPVYSLSDEDRTQMSQELGVETSDLNRGEDKTNIEYCYNNYLNGTEFHQDIDICDIVSSDNENDKNSFEAPIDNRKNMRPTSVEISKTLSSLSLKDVDQDERISIDIDCSQSILKNFNVLDNLDHNSISNEEFSNRRKICHALGTIELPSNVAVVTNSGPIINSGNNEHRTEAAEEVNKNLNTTKQSMLINSNLNDFYNYVKPGGNFKTTSVQNDLNGEISTNALQEGVLITIPVPINKKIESQSINVTKPGNPFVENSYITKSGSNVNTKLQDNITNNNSVVTLKKKRKPRIMKETEINEGKGNIVRQSLINENDGTENKIRKQTKRRTNSKKNNKAAEKDSSLPIYNKNVENDLSWLEGIRFVREIGEDEYDSKFSNLNEHFWDNYYLPPNFDDADFL